MAQGVVSDLAGRVLAGRYVLQSAIGTGASGRVYAAQDSRLRRRVAVKVLHAALAEDAAFLRRFRAEAQVAASLHHPHIVTVHDWGEDDVPFMVLELLEGGSLRSMLDHGEHLTVAQAARIGRDVASALEYAHARGILHRDIKPANLLFDEHGIVRVADFGLARALAEASWTEPSGAVFGTARYASPEQAMGASLDARSDLYSLALVLVEAVTGTVPFGADTTLGTLAARTQRPLHAPAELGALVPAVERAGRIDAAERYPDAATLRAALADVADALPPPGPLVLAGMVDGPDPHPTRAQAERTAVLFDQDAAEAHAAPVVTPDRRGGRRLVPFVVAAVLVVTAVVAGAALGQVRESRAAVPGLVGRTLGDAQAIAEDTSVAVEIAARRAGPDPEGVIVEQTPAAGSFTGRRTVRVVVSSGPAPLAVPEVLGQPWADAEARLRDDGFVVERVEEHSDDVPAESVVAVDPAAGAELAPESTVRVVVSLGRAPVAVADVTDASFADAQAALAAQGFVVERAEDEFHDSVAKGDVIRTEPAATAEAPYGSAVRVVVSRGPDVVDVRDVTGLTLDEAATRLEADGFVVEVDGPYRPGREVRSQDPPAGRQVKRGSTVTLTLQGGDD